MTWWAAVLGVVGAALVAGAPRLADPAAAVLLAQAAWVVANSIWLAAGLIRRDGPLVLQFGVFLGLSLWGLWNWRA